MECNRKGRMKGPGQAIQKKVNSSTEMEKSVEWAVFQEDWEFGFGPIKFKRIELALLAITEHLVPG